MINIDLSGKKTLITGAASGIGKETAKVFSLAGSDLMLLDIDRDNLFKTISGCSNSCQNEKFKIDLRKKDEIDDFWKKIEGNEPDILINNAGVYPFENFLDVTAKSYQDVMSVNLDAMLWMCQHFIKSRKDKGGIIINIASIEAILPFKEDLVPYSISKSGVISLTRSLARDYGQKGFRANVILPGAIKTPGTDVLVKKAIFSLDMKLMKVGYNFNSRLASGRWGKPDEVANVILFLASDLASYTQGAVIPVDGGFLSN